MTPDQIIEWIKQRHPSAKFGEYCSYIGSMVPIRHFAITRSDDDSDSNWNLNLEFEPPDCGTATVTADTPITMLAIHAAMRHPDHPVFRRIPLDTPDLLAQLEPFVDRAMAYPVSIVKKFGPPFGASQRSHCAVFYHQQRQDNGRMACLYVTSDGPMNRYWSNWYRDFGVVELMLKINRLAKESLAGVTDLGEFCAWGLCPKQDGTGMEWYQPPRPTPETIPCNIVFYEFRDDWNKSKMLRPQNLPFKIVDDLGNELEWFADANLRHDGPRMSQLRLKKKPLWWDEWMGQKAIQAMQSDNPFPFQIITEFAVDKSVDK